MVGNYGIKAKVSHLPIVFFYHDMHDDVKNFVYSFSTCQYNKYNIQAPYVLLQPLWIPQQVLKNIFMELITNLSSSSTKTFIWIVVD